MDREQKEEQVKEIAERLGEAQAVLAVDYRGLGVPQAAELREKLGAADATFKVVKNRLAKLAASEVKAEGLDDFLEGPTALTFVRGDIVTAAKAIDAFSREHEVLEFKGGTMDGQTLDADRFKTLARLPSLDIMHGQLVGMAASPLTGLVRGLGSMISGLAVALGQIQEQGLVGGEVEPSEPEAEEPAGSADDEAAGEPDQEPEEKTGEEVEEETGEKAEEKAGDEAGEESAPTEGAEEPAPEPETETDDNEPEGSEDAQAEEPEAKEE